MKIILIIKHLGCVAYAIIMKKGQKNISGIDEKIISMYARRMSDSLLSRITEKITPEITAWQRRTLEAIYPIV